MFAAYPLVRLFTVTCVAAISCVTFCISFQMHIQSRHTVLEAQCQGVYVS